MMTKFKRRRISSASQDSTSSRGAMKARRRRPASSSARCCRTALALRTQPLATPKASPASCWRWTGYSENSSSYFLPSAHPSVIKTTQRLKFSTFQDQGKREWESQKLLAHTCQKKQKRNPTRPGQYDSVWPVCLEGFVPGGVCARSLYGRNWALGVHPTSQTLHTGNFRRELCLFEIFW